MLTFRAATMDDAKILFDWRNDPVMRQAAHNTEELVFDSHVLWLGATLANPKRQLLIAEEDGHPVGMVRFDYDEVGSAEMSWNVAPEARGRGVGKRMVKGASDRFSGQSIRAEVKAENQGSIKVAEAAGMALVGRVGAVLHFRRLFGA